ncbi:acetate kinase [Candidatus Saccharibacteria bacterium]|nr:acetate kinase [Candidatus Saccharibacteria bacterium]
MSNILIINSGSSSLKFQVINSETEEMILKGNAEPLGNRKASICFKYDDQEIPGELPKPSTHADALKAIFAFLDKYHLTKTISSVGHRVVHGGEKLKESALINKEILKEIEEAVPYAPIHNPAAILGIKAVSKIAPDLPQVAVFDTAFHSTMPDYAYRYAIPTEWYTKYGVRRYGYHGTSYRFITEKLAHTLDKPVGKVNAVIAHLGSGASLAAVKNGKSADTTMGLTPLEGMIMATRSGDIDASIVPFIMKRENIQAESVINILNTESGLRGVSGVSDDTRDIEREAADGNENCQLALNMMTYKAAKLIASLMVSLDELDALVFTAGNGENRWVIRAAIVKHLEVLGFKIDDKLNDGMSGRDGNEGLISAPSSKYAIYQLVTNEELMIAKDTARIIRRMKNSQGQG